jgi:SAM-dependent methyltransferase
LAANFARRVSMRDLLSLIWAAVHEYDADENPVWPLTRAQVGRWLAPNGALQALNLIVTGNSPTYNGRPRAPFVPTTEEAVHAMLKLAEVKPGDVVYDLGCGDGRMVIAAAQLGARAVGFDINPVRLEECRANAEKAGVNGAVEFREGDLFEADIHEATVVTLFLLANANMQLREKLRAELKPGARVVSNTFQMGDWTPDQELDLGGPSDLYLSRRLYLWTVPALEEVVVC